MTDEIKSYFTEIIENGVSVNVRKETCLPHVGSCIEKFLCHLPFKL